MRHKTTTPRTGLGYLHPRLQQYYLVKRPARIIGRFVKTRFLDRIRLVKYLFHGASGENMYMCVLGHTRQNLHLNLTVRTRSLKNKMSTTLTLTIEHDNRIWKCEEKNHVDFWALLFYSLAHFPRKNTVECLRFGRHPLVSFIPLSQLLGVLEQHFPTVKTSDMTSPFTLSHGIEDSRILQFWNASDKKTFVQHS